MANKEQSKQKEAKSAKTSVRSAGESSKKVVRASSSAPRELGVRSSFSVFLADFKAANSK